MKQLAQLQVKVITPQQTIFEGHTNAVTSVNSAGRFDILPRHSQFITIIQQYLILAPPANQTLKIDSGVIYCHQNQVEIYITPASINH